MKRTIASLGHFTGQALSTGNRDGAPSHYVMAHDALFRPYTRPTGPDRFGHRRDQSKKMRAAMIGYARQQMGVPVSK